MTLYTRFSETFDLRQLTQEFDQARGEIDPHALLPDAYVTELRRHALVQSVHYSTRIEGNTLSQDQVNSLMAGSVVGATTREVQEVQNYREALSYARRMFLDQTSPITSETLRTVHFLVSKGLDDRDYAPGHYRTAQNFVIDRYSHRRLYLPPPPDRLPGLMDELIEWINSREPLHPAYRAGLAHLNLVAIHPFSDGNGRTARVLETLVMYRHGYRDVDLVSLEAYFGRDTQTYYRAIRDSLGPTYEPTRGNVQRWLEYYVDAQVVQARATLDNMRLFEAQMSALEQQFAVSEVGALALWLASLHGAVTNIQLRESANLSRGRISILLTRLATEGFLIKEGRARSVRYIPSPAVFEAFTNAETEHELSLLSTPFDEPLLPPSHPL